MKHVFFIVGVLFLCVPGFSQETITVKVFFHNEKLNPNMEDCRKVFPIDRFIPTADETKDIIANLNVKKGNAYLNFKKIVYAKLGNATTSCGGGFFSSVEE